MEQLATGSLASSASLPGDLELVQFLRQRDGDLPARVPSHAPRGRCKYAVKYPTGGCPWCREKRA